MTLSREKAALQRYQKKSHSVAILNAGCGDDEQPDQPKGIHEHMSLAPNDFLAAIKASRAALVGGLHALTIVLNRFKPSAAFFVSS